MYHPITRATFNVTRACNLRCSYCFTHGCTYGRMNWDTARAGIRFLVQNAIDAQEREIEIDFWGGEPLLEWDLIRQMAQYTRRVTPNNIRIRFGGTTNGVLLTPEKFDFCDEYRIGWMLSIDGTAETHDAYRKTILGHGSHGLIVGNAKLALKRWPWLKARFSPSAEFVHKFFEDAKYLYELGFNHLMFSPVHESGWDAASYGIMEEQSIKLIDWMAEQKKAGRTLSMEHFNTYGGPDHSKWPCGAGRFYVGIDIDGGIYPCHRFIKFNDPRPWHKREVAIGHVEIGITNPEWREQFITWTPGCKGAANSSDCYTNTPCHGGCYAVNFDLTGNIHTPAPSICDYVAMQARVSQYYKACGLANERAKYPRGRSCVCNNMCYAENTEDEIKGLDPATNHTCICYFADYTGSHNPDVARSLISKE